MNDYNISDYTLSFLDNCTKIDLKEFKNNKLIKKIIIGENIESIDAEAFSLCSNIEQIVVDEKNRFFISPENSNAIINIKNNMLVVGCKNTIIPKCVTSIGPFAFCGQTELETITIPTNVKSVNSYAFDGCSKLKEVIIQEGVEYLGEFAFKNCESLKTIYIPNSLQDIERNAFGVIENFKEEWPEFEGGDFAIENIYYGGKDEDFILFFWQLFNLYSIIDKHVVNIYLNDGSCITIPNDKITNDSLLF